MLRVFWDMKRPITIDFLEKRATVNSISYCHLLRQYSPSLLNDPCVCVCVCVCVYIYIYIYIYTERERERERERTQYGKSNSHVLL